MPKSAPKLDLTITVRARSGRQHVAYLHKYVMAAHKVMKSPLCELSVVLVGDKQMSDLHVQFMQIPGPTDVLTFPLDVNSRGRATGGEVVVCVPEARRRARLHKAELRHELLLYVVHGMLHLDGYDDRTISEFEQIHRAEDKILNKIGVAAAGVGGDENHQASMTTK